MNRTGEVFKLSNRPSLPVRWIRKKRKIESRVDQIIVRMLTIHSLGLGGSERDPAHRLKMVIARNVTPPVMSKNLSVCFADAGTHDNH